MVLHSTAPDGARPAVASCAPCAGGGRWRWRWRATAVAIAVVAAVATACGSGSGSGSGSAKGDLAVEIASYDLAQGPPDRFIAGLLTNDQHLIGFGSVQMQFSFLGAKQAGVSKAVGSPVTATFLTVPGADVPSPLPTGAEIVQGAQRGVYAARFGFDQAGFWQVEVTAQIGGTARRGTGAFQVGRTHQVPAVGDPALPSDNLTVSSTDAPKAAVDSRAGSSGDVPDPELHSTTIAAALAAHRPAVVVFATPVFCISRFCGPITDMVDDLSKTYADRASFVHVEIWRDFQNNTLNKAAADWLYRNNDLNEPWVFVIGADGRIAARFDNVTTRAEVEPLLQALPVIGPAT
ncbi:MAG: hypothetical protein ABR511_02175 [Acidimicrobiales bacterium]